MSEIEIRRAIFDKIIQILTLKYMTEEIEGFDDVSAWLEKFPICTIASVLCAHLKLYLGTIIQHMVYYKKKHLFYCRKLNGKTDPRMPKKRKGPNMPKSKKAHTMSSVIAYENTPFTAKEFFQMLKDHEDLIPKRSFYHRYMEQLASLDSMKPSVSRADQMMMVRKK